MTEKLLRDTLKESQEYVLYACEKSHYEGPITLVPLNEISKSF